MPRVLLIATLHTLSSARLSQALCAVGFEVEAVCARLHPIRYLQAPPRLHRLGYFSELRSIKRAIDLAEPDILVPCDEPAVALLHRLHAREPDSAYSELIERSLGNPAMFEFTRRKSNLMALASSLGLAVPRSLPVSSLRVLPELGKALGYPLVLKRDSTWGGTGVTIVKDASELSNGWSRIAGLTSLLRAAKCAFQSRRIKILIERVASRFSFIEAQSYVAGTPANRTIVCWKGQVLAGFSALALDTWGVVGPASLIKFIDHPQMAKTAELLAGKLGLSGFHGLDFVVTPSGEALLLELNPRATPTSHLAVSADVHLPSALYRAVTRSEPRAIRDAIASEQVALFPDYWQQHLAHGPLPGVYHDVPWDESAILDRLSFTV